MKKTLFLLALLFSNIFSFSQQNDDQSLLWEITGNGLKSPSYLYGTMHVSSKLAFHLGDTFYRALQQAEVIALESDPGKWMEEMFDSKSAMSMNGYSSYLNFDSDKNFYEKLTSVEFPDKKTLTNALRNKHALQNGFLYRGSSYGNEYEETTYLDLFIYQYGKKNKKTVVNLENHEETNLLQIMAMLPDTGLTKEEKKQRSKKRKSYYSKWNEDMTVSEALEEAYRNGHVNVIDSIMKLTSRSDNYMKYFLYARNRIMADGMDSLMKTKKIFVGIGAAHLAGEEGVIQMMKDMGYSMRPVKRNITQFAKDQKNKIEEFFIPVPFKKQTTKDGYITVNMPGKLYETPGKDGDIQYFYPEMTNGGYFFIRRFNTFSPFHELNPKEWAKRVDSLVFENIEGKILSEKKITVSGYDAKDILNKTRKGDYQRRIIIYTPLEVLFFKMSGTGEWVKDFGDQFFNHIQLNRRSEQEYTYTSHLNDYQITFPTAPVHNVHAEKISQSQRHIVHSFNEKDSAYYLLFSSHINDLSYIEEDSFEVKFLARTFFEQLDSAEIDTVILLDNKTATARGTLNNKSIFVKTLLKRNFYFVLVAQGTESNANKYFDSFDYSGDFKTIKPHLLVDTILGFSVETTDHPDAVQTLSYSVQKTRSWEDKNPWDSYRSRRYFYSDETQERVYLHYYKFVDYYTSKSLDDFWESELSNYTDDTYIIDKKTIDNNDTVPTCHLLLADTNSTKRIEIKKYLNQGVLFTIKTTYDSIAPKSQFIDTFFKTFQPSRDSLIGKVITENCADSFFADLRSMDSLRVKKAVELVNRITFEKQHIDSILWYATNYEFPDNDEEGTKVYLIRELGYIKSPRVIKLLTQLYENSDEDYEEQFAALKGLAQVGTKNAYKALGKLLMNNPPIASSTRNVEYLFNYLDDSLSLNKQIYPELWDLMLYDKYRVSVYELSTSMLDSGFIKSKSYKKYKPLILRRAKYLTQDEEDVERRIRLSGRDYYYKDGEKIYFEKYLIDQFSKTKYLKLLIPFYKKDKDVQKYFTKMYQSQNNENRYVAAVLFAQNNLTVPDSVLQVLSSSANYAYPFYHDLKLAKKLKWFTPSEFSQEKMAKSILYAGSSSIDPEEDSINFVKKVAYTEGGKTGYIYCYKSESSYGHKWYLHYAGVMPEDSTQIMPYLDFDFVDRKITVYNEKEIDKEIENSLKKLYLRNRKRAKKYRY